MKSDRRWPVAIVGAGFSGTILAAQLARRGIPCALIEATERVGQGTAYSTEEPAHLLNVPAGNMSAWADDPSHFAARSGDPKGFAQRRHFGEYLQTVLKEATEAGADVIRGRVVAARQQSGWTVELAAGEPLSADSLVLATGNQPPHMMRMLQQAGDRAIANPWLPEARRAIGDVAASGAPVLIVGTGLTMVDVVLSLDAAGHSGRIVALSRRGLFPRGHAPYDAQPVERSQVPHKSVRSLMGWLRRMAARSGGWRAAVDSLRPHSQNLWQALPRHEKQRFLRHARPWWDVHRHRIAPQIADRLHELMAAGRLEIVAGRLTQAKAEENGVSVEFRRRGAEQSSVGRFAYIFNCTGPLHEIDRTDDPLLRQMLDEGLIEADELGIGVEVDARSRIIGSDRLWALGPLTKGRFWEIIAVPDIREQAAQVADDIARELGR